MPSLYLTNVTPEYMHVGAQRTADIYDSVLKLRTWNTAASEEGAAVWDAIELISRETAANIRKAVGTVDNLFDEARRWSANTLDSNNVWLYAASDGETARRSLVYDGAILQVTEGRNNPLMPQSGGFFNLSLQRDQYWENPSISTVLNAERYISGGTHVAIVNSGTAPCTGRIYKTTIGDGPDSVSLTSTGQWNDLWLGMRPIYNGGTGFIPVCDLDGATTANGGGSTGPTAGYWSEADNYINFITGGSALLQRFSVTLSQIQPDTTVLDDYIGTYLLMLRTKLVGASDVVRYQVHVSNDRLTTTDEVIGDVYVDAAQQGNGGYRLIPVGNVTIPPMGNRGNVVGQYDHVFLPDLSFQIQAQAVSVASGTTYLDGFYLLPAEHMAYVTGCNMTFKAPTLTHAAWLYNYPDGSYLCVYTAGTASPGAYPQYSVSNWELPSGSALICCIHQGGTATGHTLTNGTADITMQAHYRYRTFIP